MSFDTNLQQNLILQQHFSPIPLFLVVPLTDQLGLMEPRVYEMPARAHLASDGPEAAAVISRAALLLLAELSDELGQLMRTLSDQSAHPDTNRAASTTSVTFSHRLTR